LRPRLRAFAEEASVHTLTHAAWKHEERAALVHPRRRAVGVFLFSVGRRLRAAASDSDSIRWLSQRRHGDGAGDARGLFYGVMGGIPLQAVLGGVGGLLGAWSSRPDEARMRRNSLVVSILFAVPGIVTLAVLDYIIGPW
jgi:hypothetical protein